MFNVQIFATEDMVLGARKFPTPESERGKESVVLSGIPIEKYHLPVSLASLSSRPYKKKYCSFLLNHNGRFKAIWDWFVLILVIFTAIHVPYTAAFSHSNDIILDMIINRDVQPMLIIGLLVDCMFVMDIFINFRTTYVKSSSDEVVARPRLLARRYLRTWFLVDLLAAIPFDWIMHNLKSTGTTSTLVGLMKSARLLRLFRVARKIDRYSEYGVAVLFLLMSLFTLISHWLACVWNAISLFEEDNPNSWVRRMDLLLHVHTQPSVNMSEKINMGPETRYIASLYFVISSLTSVGFGNISATTEAEQVFCVILMLLGALMYACIFGNMVAIVQRLYSKASSFHTHMNTVREFLKYYKIPEELRISVNNYVRREWNQSQGVDVDAVLRRFPDSIQADITYELYQGLLHNVIPFKYATVSCMRAIAMSMKTVTLQANNYALRQGEELNRLYILGRGSLEILVGGDLVDLLARHSTFGYDFVKKPSISKSKANVRASCLVEIHFIHKDVMMKVLRLYPNFAVKFRKYYRHGFDLNDRNEEGYFRVMPAKEKLHIAAMAKNVLGMPIMAKFERMNRMRKLSQKIPIEEEDGIKEECLADAKSRYQGSTESLKTIHRRRRPSITSHDSITFENNELHSKVKVLERNLNEFQAEIACKIDLLLQLLQPHRLNTTQSNNICYKCVSTNDDLEHGERCNLRNEGTFGNDTLDTVDSIL